MIQKAGSAKVCKKLTFTVSKANASIKDVELQKYMKEKTEIRKNFGLAISYKPSDEIILVTLHDKSEEELLKKASYSAVRKRKRSDDTC